MRRSPLNESPGPGDRIQRPSRREFVSFAALAGVAALIPSAFAVRDAHAHAAAVRSGKAAPVFANLTPAEASEIKAIAARIMPTTATPGANEAGVVFFIDRAADDFVAPMLPFIRDGLTDLSRRAAASSPGAGTFAALSVVEQDSLLRTIEDGPFFGLMRFLTMLGMFSDPSYDGNRDEVGWKLIGFKNEMVHQPPFGYYDAQVPGGRD